MLANASRGIRSDLSTSRSWIETCSAFTVLRSASEGSTEMTLACCPLSWISLTVWPWCCSLKSQSRKTPGLIRYDGSACHPNSIWRTKTSCLDE